MSIGGFRFSVSKLPVWAQKQIYSRPSVAADIGIDVSNINDDDIQCQNRSDPIAGKWAEVSCIIYMCIY